jgi:hypothetical protein
MRILSLRGIVVMLYFCSSDEEISESDNTSRISAAQEKQE